MHCGIINDMPQYSNIAGLYTIFEMLRKDAVTNFVQIE